MGCPYGASCGGGRGYTYFYPCSFRCRLMDLCLDASRVGSPQRCVRKDVDTSDNAAMTVPWRILGLCVAPKWFICTDAMNDEKIILFSLYGIPSSNLFVMPVCVSNVHHLSQLPLCLVAVVL